MIDKVTSERIKKLHPLIRKEMEQIITECNKALTGKAKVRIAQGLRTFEEQENLYNQRPKVTNARGGQSIHNYGFAVDIVLIIDGKTASWDVEKDWDGDRISDWKECVSLFDKHGWDWGGNWRNFKDFPHFEKRGYNNWRDLINKKKDKEGYVIL